jgi:hypothetical protein
MLFEPSLEEGPVQVKIEYKINNQQQQQQQQQDNNNKNTINDFLRALRDLSKIRKRDGANHWGVYRDGTDLNIYVESFVVESWAEHLRQHERLTAADIEIQNKARSFHVGDKPPVVSHFIAEPLPSTSKKDREVKKKNTSKEKEKKTEENNTDEK